MSKGRRLSESLQKTSVSGWVLVVMLGPASSGSVSSSITVWVVAVLSEVWGRVTGTVDVLEF